MCVNHENSFDFVAPVALAFRMYERAKREKERKKGENERKRDK